MDYIALTGVNYFLKRGYRLRRMAVVAFLASILSLLLHIYITNAGIRIIVLHFGLNMAMAILAFGWSGKKRLLENWLVIYMTIILLGGIMEWEESLGFPATFFWGKAMIAAVLLSGINTYFMQKKSFMEKIYPIEVMQEGKAYSLNGYWDSGNLLIDPYLNEPVQIMNRTSAEQIFGENMPPMRLVPYRALGSDGALLSVCNAQAMYIYQGKQKKEIRPVVLGIADKGLFDGKEYDVILQASMIEGENI